MTGKSPKAEIGRPKGTRNRKAESAAHEMPERGRLARVFPKKHGVNHERH